MTTVWFEGGEDYAPSAAVRRTVFIDEQGYLPEEEFDEADKTCPHLAIFDGETPVAAGRLLFDGTTAKLGRIAVLKPYRGRRLGAAVVEALLARARGLGAGRAYVSAQSYAVPFYEKFGFRAYGEEYPDGRIPHRDMEMPL